jgi:hypothetical protein
MGSIASSSPVKDRVLELLDLIDVGQLLSQPSPSQQANLSPTLKAGTMALGAILPRLWPTLRLELSRRLEPDQLENLRTWLRMVDGKLDADENAWRAWIDGLTSSSGGDSSTT